MNEERQKVTDSVLQQISAVCLEATVAALNAETLPVVN